MHLKVKSLHQLENILDSYNIPHRELWGRNLARSTSHLLDELICGKSTLEVIEGKLIRRVKNVTIHLYHPLPHGLWQELRKHRRILPNKRIKDYKRPMSFSTKIAKGETPFKAAIRIMQDEIGFRPVKIFEVTQFLPGGSSPVFERETQAYPGLPSVSLPHVFVSRISEKKYKPTEYRHEKPDGTLTLYKWIPIAGVMVPRVLWYD